MRDEVFRAEVKSVLEAAKGNVRAQLAFVRALVENCVLVDADSVVGIFDVRVVERVEDRPVDEDCHKYLFGSSITGEEVLQDLRGCGTPLSRPEAGALIYYSGADGCANHVAFATDDKSAISKWGPDSHVYKHPIVVVPTSYGENISIYRIPENWRIRILPQERILAAS